jgi:4-hydroxy-tetrahydrodipicolinate reductase
VSDAVRPMRLGIVGFGKMGREIEAAAGRRGHTVAWTLEAPANRGGCGITADRVGAVEAVFEFTGPESAPANLLALAALGARVVCGSTGWTGELARISDAFRAGGGALVHAANFSIGVRHFYDIAARAAALYVAAGYAPYLVEEHHAAKKDAPSGTARALAREVERAGGQAPPVASVRAGTIPGTHRLVFESPEDEVELIHRARGRAGFARGAVWAAERIAGRRGVFEFGEILGEASGLAKEDP